MIESYFVQVNLFDLFFQEVYFDGFFIVFGKDFFIVALYYVGFVYRFIVNYYYFNGRFDFFFFYYRIFVKLEK